MRRIVSATLIVTLLVLTAGAKTVDMDGRSASLAGRANFKVKKLGKDKYVTDFNLDFETRTWLGTQEEGAVDLSGTFQFDGKGGRKLDIAFDAPSLAEVERRFGERASALLLEEDGIDSTVTADVTYYKITFKLSKNKKKAKLKGKFRCEYTVDDGGDQFKGTVKLPMKGAVAREDP